MKKSICFYILTTLCLTHSSLLAQWVKTNCPLYPEALCNSTNYIFAGSDAGVVRSSDDGNTWEIVNKGLQSDVMPAEVLSFYSFGYYLFAYVPNIGGGEFRSGNDGENWSFLSSNGLTISANQDGYLFSHYVNGSGILRSSDSGNSWVLIDSGFSHFYQGMDSRKLLFRPPVSLNHVLFTVNLLGEIYKSTNNGDYWDSISKVSLPSHNATLSLFATNTTLFTIVSGIILRSLDRGYSWDTVKSDFGTNVLSAIGNNIFAGGYYGIILSTNNGDTWLSVNDRKLDSVVIDALIIRDGFLFAASYFTAPNLPGGLWRRSLSNLGISSVINQKLDADISLFPNPATGNSVILNFDKPITETTEVKIFDVLGREVYKRNIFSESSFQIPIRNLQNGIYYARINIDGKTLTEKFEVMR